MLSPAEVRQQLGTSVQIQKGSASRAAILAPFPSIKPAGKVMQGE